uniref:GST N-terminal domain-containing protein n=1 Tax=Corethron hystrix TaxID=216773 RepID=A0A7S1FUL2_9STRA|mmetsp:Transcript_33286/g.76819  ORF Transcript_33286/g.76819 Transcript_33286/m.76819 type:complete len:318 (+) Transcript_33286:87-1040(+)
MQSVLRSPHRSAIGRAIGRATRRCEDQYAIKARTVSNDAPKKAKEEVHSDIKLYQYAICPFCNINKALLSYTDTPYEIVEVNPLSKAELSFSADGYKKVPVATVRTDDAAEPSSSGPSVRQIRQIRQINGSEEIGRALLALPSVLRNLSLRNGLPLATFQSSPRARKWETFSREELAPVLYPNICRSWSESYEAFGYVNDAKGFTTVQKGLIRGVGSLAMLFAASKIKSKRNITDEREALRSALSKWAEEGLDGNGSYGSGAEHPDMGDIAMFGVMNSISGLRTHEEVILGRGGEDANPVVLDWYLRMREQVGSTVY